MNQTIKLPLAEKTSIKNWNFELQLEKAQTSEEDFMHLLPEGAKNAIIIVDGELVHQSVEDSISIGNAEISELRTQNGLIDLNIKHKNSSLSVSLGKNSRPKEALYIFYVAGSRSLVHQTEIILGPGSELEVVETFLGDAKYNSNILRNIRLDANSKLNTSVINRLNGSTALYYHSFAEAQSDAVLSSYNFILNDSSMVFEDFNYMLGNGANAEVSTVSIATGEQKHNITVRIENLASHSIGNIVNYGITSDTAHLAFNGIGKIHQGMKGVDNQQETRILSLSKHSEAVANPFLLIDEGDITAGHAASIGQVNEEQIYYLMSRGMSRQESEKLIASGFLTPFADNIQNNELKNELLKVIAEKLG